MDYFLIILGVLCIFAGIAGSILPGLPGPPLSYAGLLLIHWTSYAQLSFNTLFIWAIVVIIVSILDYIIPILGTKGFGGTKAGVKGSTVGLIMGVILLPVLGPLGILGIIGGPFIGALVGERYAGQDSDKALKAAIGSFIGFLAGTLIKLVVAIVIAVYFFKELFQSIL